MDTEKVETKEKSYSRNEAELQEDVENADDGPNILPGGGIPAGGTHTAIQRIPAEIWTEIFRNFSHTEKLIARMVCSFWNLQISTLLSKTSHFALTSRSSHQVLLDSSIHWTKIKLSEYTFKFDDDFKRLISTLDLEAGSFYGPDFTERKKIVAGFTNLRALKMNMSKNSELIFEDDDRSFVSNNDFKNVMGKLKILTFTFPFNEYTSVVRILHELRTQQMSLNELRFIEGSNPTKYSTPTTGFPMSTIYHLIYNFSGSLKHLEIKFRSKTVRKQLFPNLVSRLSLIKNLQLKSVLIHYDPTDGNIERDFTIYQEFLMTQGAAVNINLPWCSNSDRCQDLIRSLPPSIESADNVKDEHITDDFPSFFRKLVSLSIEPKTSVFSYQSSSVRRLGISHTWIYPVVLIENEANNLSFYRNLSHAFVNLAELNIVELDFNYTTFFDAHLQSIIKELRQLRILQIDNCEGITDFGVTGISRKHISDLIQTRGLYMYPEIPAVNQRGFPLSSLKMLEKLVLGATAARGSEITDAGIYFGLQFGSTLKQLTFCSNSDEVSDWGLHQLGIGNSGLEAIDGCLTSKRITTVALDKLKQLPLLKLTQKFKLLRM